MGDHTQNILLVFFICLLFPLVQTYFSIPETQGYVVDVEGRSVRQENGFSLSAWTFPWDGDTKLQLERWGNVLDEISPYWYWSMPNGTVISIHNESRDLSIYSMCMNTSTDLIPMVSNNHDTEVIENILYDNITRKRHICELLNITMENDLSGLDINYENIPTYMKDRYSDFIFNLTETFHNNGKKIHISVFPKISKDEDREGPGAYDYERLGSYADNIRLMVYNLHWSSVDVAGPIVSYPWVEEVVKYATSTIDPSKIILGIPQYSYDWEVNRYGKTLSVARNMSFSEIEKIKKDYNIERKWNATSRTPYYEYRESNGIRHALHFCDAESLLHELKIVEKYSLKGISLWKIGGEDPQSLFYMEYLKTKDISDLPPYLNMGYDIVGKVGTDIEMGPVRGYDIEGMLTSIEWDFGDGTISHILEPIHRYERGGSYDVMLTLIDDSENSIKMCKSVKIGPFSNFTIEGELLEDKEVVMNGTTSWDYSYIISYNWDLGDGTYRFHDDPVITHVYAKPGIYDVSLTVMNKDGYVDTEIRSIQIPDLEKPISNAGKDQVIWEDSYLTLDGWSSSDNGLELNYTWIFPDGSRYYSPVVSIYIEDPGYLSILLNVTDDVGLSDIDVVNITVKDRTAPVIDVIYPVEVVLGEYVYIDAGLSSDNIGIVNYTWDLGEGIILYDKGSIMFKPEEARRYHITLDIIDGQGNWNSSTFYVDVLDIDPPTANYSIDPTPRSINDSYLKEISRYNVSLFDVKIDGVVLEDSTLIFSLYDIYDRTSINRITWYFGDGTTAGGPIVYHQFNASGIYQVQFIVYDVHSNFYCKNITLLVIPSWNHSVTEIENYDYEYLNNTFVDIDEVEGGKKITMYMVIIILIAVVLVIVLIADIISIASKFHPDEDLKRISGEEVVKDGGR